MDNIVKATSSNSSHSILSKEQKSLSLLNFSRVRLVLNQGISSVNDLSSFSVIRIFLVGFKIILEYFSESFILKSSPTTLSDLFYETNSTPE